MRTLSFLFLALLIATGGNAQFTQDYYKAANEYYAKGDYYSAAQYFEKYLAGAKGKSTAGYKPYTVNANSGKSAGKVGSREQAVYKAAESYRLLNYFEKAEPLYREAVSFDKTQFPLAQYWHGTSLRALGMYAEAEQAFIAFRQQYTTQDQYGAAAEREIMNLRFIQQQLARKDINRFSVNKLAVQGDTGATYAPVWTASQTLLITSTRPEKDGAEKAHTNRVYEASYAGGAITAVTKTALPQPKDVQQGVLALSADGNTMYFTRWTIGEGKKTAAIYSSQRGASGWSEPTAVSALNVAGANTQQPAITPDGKRMLFASDRPGGLGGFDLYSADINADGSIGAATNLGGSINTAFDEQAPYYHAASSSLVFSSNGRVGMGEYDLFYAKDSAGAFAAPQNFGYPVNSIKDDIYFASKGSARNILEDVLFSSDRSSACCLELFHLQKRMPLKQVSGQVLACDGKSPLPNAVVTIVDTVANRILYNLRTDSAGRFAFTLEEFQPLKAVASTANFYTSSVDVARPADAEQEQLTAPELCLTAIELNKPMVVENVYYEFAEADVKPESYAELDRLVRLMNENPTIVAEISAHTDSKGTNEYNQRLSEARARSVVNYLVSKGISAERLVVRGYGETQPIAPNENPDGSDNPEGRERNRRTEFKVIRN